MKKLTSILLSLVLVFSFAACSNNSSDKFKYNPKHFTNGRCFKIYR